MVGAISLSIGICILTCGCRQEFSEPSRAHYFDATTLTIDGSSTVFPIVEAIAEDFAHDHPGSNPTVNKSGTGSGFQKFERGEIDIATASRPIQPEEDAALKSKAIDYIEIPIAYDGVSIIVNPENDWVDSLTTLELKRAWNQQSLVTYWSDIRPNFPHEKIVFHSPTDNHGTYEYFTETINRKRDDLREDCQKDQEPNTIIQAIAGEKYAIGYAGFNYYEQNRDKVRVVPVDAGRGPITPSADTIASGAYAPLSRPLFLYVSKRSYDLKPQVKAFVQFALGGVGDKDVRESSYVGLPKELHDAVVARVLAEQTGTVFAHLAPGARLVDLYSKAGQGKGNRE